MVFNKIDKVKTKEPEDHEVDNTDDMIRSYNELRNSWIAKTNNKSIFISAKNKTNIQELRKMLYTEVKKIHVQRYPYDDLYY
jgi:GTP-binding protein HflX